MEIEAKTAGASQSFFTPPEPKTVPTSRRGDAAHERSAREAGASVSRTHRAPARVAGPPVASEERETLEGQRRRGGQWFYWLAGLSLINSIVAFTGQDWRFILGLGVTQVVHELAQESGRAGITAGLVTLAVIGFFVVLGQRAVAGYRWAFLSGLSLYALDGVIFVLIEDWVGVGFHIFVLTMVLRGYLAARRLSSLTA